MSADIKSCFFFSYNVTVERIPHRRPSAAEGAVDKMSPGFAVEEQRSHTVFQAVMWRLR